MKTPISWLKEFVDIKLPLEELMWKMTEAGLTCESYEKVGKEIVLNIEVTANRPDWMSILGIAREIAAIQGVKINEPKTVKLPKPTKNLQINIHPNYQLIERWSAIILSGITIKSSPEWIAERLKLVGLRPINNVVDITNYVMFELGIPMHAFDYDDISGHQMNLQLSKCEEDFTSVDNLTYKLPKGSMIIKDSNRLIDLVGIKGGYNSGIKPTSKNILLHVTIDNPVLIRRTSIALGLRSEASAIYERGPNKGGVITSLARASELILKYTGGVVSSKIIDLKEKDFKPWKLVLNRERLEKVLGIKIPEKSVVNILERLNLSPKLSSKNISCLIPTYRGDLKIEEDLIEEVARIYGYNHFPKTLPFTQTSQSDIPYYFDDSLHLKIKTILISSGYSETMTLSLISTDLINKTQMELANQIKIANPVSIDYEYMRTSLIPSLLGAVKINSGNCLKIFEINKVYFDKLDSTLEPYKIAGITKGVSFPEFKGTIDLLLDRLDIHSYEIYNDLPNKSLWHPIQAGSIKCRNKLLGNFGLIHPQVLENLEINENVYAFEFDIDTLQNLTKIAKFKPIPKYPAQVEDITIILPNKTKVGEVINSISSIDKTISLVELREIYENAYTFRICYQSLTKTLTNEEVAKIRKKIISKVKDKFGGDVKS